MGVIKPPMRPEEVLAAVLDVKPTPTTTLQLYTKASTLTIEWNNFSSLRSRLCGHFNPQATATVETIATANMEGAGSQYATQTHSATTMSTLQAIPTRKQNVGGDSQADTTGLTDGPAATLFETPETPETPVTSLQARKKGTRISANTNTTRQDQEQQSYPYARDPKWAPSGFITSSIAKRRNAVEASTATDMPTILTPPIKASSTPGVALHALAISIFVIFLLFAFAAYLIALRSKITHTNKRAQHPPTFSRIVRDSLTALFSKPQPQKKKKRSFVGKDKDVEIRAGDQLHHGYVVVSPPDSPYTSMTTPTTMKGSFGSSTAMSAAPHSAHRRRFPRTPSTSSVDYLFEHPSSGAQTPRSPRGEVQDEESLVEKSEQGLEIGKRGIRAVKGFYDSLKEEQMNLTRLKDGCRAVPDDTDERPLLPI